MRFYCHFCHKAVSTEVQHNAVVRAILCCPECLQEGKVLLPDDKHSREQMARVAHELWCNWMEFLFSKCDISPGGVAKIPQRWFDEWALQSGKRYYQLADPERDRARADARAILAALVPERHERNKTDDMGWDPQGRPIAIGPEAAAEHEAIMDDPDAKPVLMVAENDRGMGVRVFGPPDPKVADLLQHIANTYRATVDALTEQAKGGH